MTGSLKALYDHLTSGDARDLADDHAGPLHAGSGPPFAVMVMLVIITAVASALLDKRHHGAADRAGDPARLRAPGRDPAPYLIAEAMAPNIGRNRDPDRCPPNM